MRQQEAPHNTTRYLMEQRRGTVSRKHYGTMMGLFKAKAKADDRLADSHTSFNPLN